MVKLLRRKTKMTPRMTVKLIVVAFLFILQVDHISAQSCVISPNITSLTIRGGLVRNIEFHCQCIDDNGMMINGMWFRGNSSTALSTGDSTSTAPYQINSITRNILFINSPFTSSFAATYYCSPNNVRTNADGDNIVLSTGSVAGNHRSYTIYSTSLFNMTVTNGLITSGAIVCGTPNVILYCICRIDDVAVGPVVWFKGDQRVPTYQGGINNPYTRDSVPSPLIFTSFTASNVGTYGCGDGVPNSLIDLDLFDCVISPRLTYLTVRGGLVQNIELHCQCMNSDGMIITGARWFYNGTIVPFGTTESTSGAIYQNNSIARNILFINQPFIRASHAGTYTCSPNDVLSSGPQITLNATSNVTEDRRSYTIYSTSLINMTVNNGSITSGAIVCGTPNVILYCICRIDDVAVGPVVWFKGDQRVPTYQGGINNPYTRDSVPSPLIFTSFTASNVGTYGCGDGVPNSLIDLDLFVPVDLPTNVISTVLTPRSIQVTWTPPSSLSDVTGYLISYATTASYARNGSVMVNGSNATSGTLSNLKEGTTYTITVQSTSNDGLCGNNNAVTVTTQAIAPSSPPQNVMVASFDPSSLMVSWQPPPAIDHNGPITGYVINYTRVGSSDMMSVNVTSGTVYTISELVTYVIYSVTVAAMNVNGTGPFSNSIVELSGEARPSEPASLNIVFINSNTVILQWRPPLTPNGVIILYSLKYNLTAPVANISSNELMYTVGGLSSENVYIFQVTAHTRAGEGPPISITVVIPPRPVTDFTIPDDTVTSSELTLNWMEVTLTNSVLIHYTVFYSPVSDPYDRIMASNRRKRQLVRAGEFSMDFPTGTTGTLTGLNGSVTYRIQVAAVVMLNVNGQIVTGDRSTESEITTLEGVPTPPRDLSAMVLMNNDVRLTWSRPNPPNGLITQYNVSYVNTNTQDSNVTIMPVVDGGDSTLSITWTGLNEGSYNFIVVASTAAGSGEAVNLPQSIAIDVVRDGSSDGSSDSTSDDNNGVIIAFATLLAIALIGLVIAVVIIICLVVKRKQLRYDINQSNVKYSDVKQSVSRGSTISNSTNKPSEPEYEAVDAKTAVILSDSVEMDANPAYQATS